ncbi:MAG: InlB B-repeat-containing protein [Ruminococcus sp.]|jgi:uncharacterized repeat protein (TIGR02543 family)|nr:InlB B-repeat-containing protein [Ruminococcus sp.]
MKRSLKILLSAVFVCIAALLMSVSAGAVPIVYDSIPGSGSNTININSDFGIMYNEIVYEDTVSIGSGTMTLNRGTKTLTLENVVFTTTDPVAWSIEYSEALTIELSGNNSLGSIFTGDATTTGLLTSCPLNFTGTGSLYVHSGDSTAGGYAYGLSSFVSSGDVVTVSECTVNIVGGNSYSGSSFGISYTGGDIRITDSGNLVVYSTGENNNFAINKTNLTGTGIIVNGGSFTAYATNCSGYSYGLYGAKIRVTDGEASLSGNSSASYDNFTIGEEDSPVLITHRYSGLTDWSYVELLDEEDVLISTSAARYAEIYSDYEKISFESNGGDEVDPIFILDGDYSEDDLPEPIRAGYEFAGWFTDDDTFEEEVTELSDIDETTTLYAKWDFIAMLMLTEDGNIILSEDGEFSIGDEIESGSPFAGGTIIMDKTTKTLTLEDVNFTTAGATAFLIDYSQDLNIVLVGDNSFTSTYDGVDESYGILRKRNGDLNFTGDGTSTLTVQSGDSSVYASHGILMDGRHESVIDDFLTVENCTLNVRSGDGAAMFDTTNGIYLIDSSLIIGESGVLNVSSGTGPDYSNAIAANTNSSQVSVDGGCLNATAGEGTYAAAVFTALLTLEDGTAKLSSANQVVTGDITINNPALIRIKENIADPWTYITDDDYLMTTETDKYTEITTDYAIVTLNNEGEESTLYRFFDDSDSLPSPTREGYDFLGWFDDFDTEVTAIDDLDGEVTLTAHWVQRPVNDDPEEETLPAPKDDLSDYATYPTYQNGGISETDDTVIAIVNKSGTVNGDKTAKAVKSAAKRLRQKGATTVNIIVPAGAIGLSAKTASKIVNAAGDLKTSATLYLYDVKSGEVIGTVTLPLKENKQILTGVHIFTERIAENVAKTKAAFPGIEVAASFEPVQKGGWGAKATLNVTQNKIGLEAAKGDEIYLAVYDSKADKWYQSPAKSDGEIITMGTSRTGVYMILKTAIQK